jgi:hypothetical protein
LENVCPSSALDARVTWRDVRGVIRFLSRSIFSLTVLSMASCAGPPVSSAITGEPVCADYSIGVGGAKLKGGLRFPVRVTVLDDDDPITKVLIFGKHNASAPNPKLILPDTDATYKVEWSQCGNEHLTAAVTATKAKSLRTDGATAYDCGEAKVYKTGTLTTKKGDPASHALAFEAPPAAECWQDAKPDAVVDAGVPDAAPAAEIPDAGSADAEATDASVSDAEAPDGASSDASTGADAAPAKEGGDKPAEKPAEKKEEKPVKAEQPVK